MSKTTREFVPADRYLYDFGLCSCDNGFAQLDTSQDASYYGTWANPYKLIIFSYCEGDTATIECEDDTDFIKEMREMQQWNVEAGYGFSIDAYKAEHVARWKELGFSDIVH